MTEQTASEWSADDYDAEFCAPAVASSAVSQLHLLSSSTATAVQPAKEGRTDIGRVLDAWRRAGPLIHEPTGVLELDELTGGGPVYGSRWYLAGAPDAGKTAFLVQLANVLAQRGVTVGLLAVDEDAGDVVTRFAQRVGFSRSHCEIRDPVILDDIATALAALPVRLYDGSWTIEDAAADLNAFAQARAEHDPEAHPQGPRAMLGIDSVQTVRCDADANAEKSGRELAEVSAVTFRVQAIRKVASRYRLIAIATSEFGRGAYRSSDPSQQTTTLAAGKWSGAIEYSARVLLGLRSVSNQPGLIEMDVAKNKHGPRDRKIYLRIDRASQTFTATQFEPQPRTSENRDTAARERVSSDAIVVAKVLLAKPGLGVREFRSEVRAASGIGSDRVDAALAHLGEAVVRGTAPRGAKPMSLDTARLPVGLQLVLRGAS